MAKQKIQMDEITENIPAFESSDFFYKDLTEFEQMVWRLMKPNKGVVNLMSPPGFGKTAFAKSFAEKIGKLFIELHLTSYEETDIASKVGIRPNGWIARCGGATFASNDSGRTSYGWPTSSSAQRTRVSRASPLPPSGERS